MQEKGISNKITEAWALEDFYVSINNTEICDIDIVGFEAIYGGCNIPAKFSFLDSQGLLTGDTKNSSNIGIGGLVEIGYTTAQGCSHSDRFIITKVHTENNSHNQKLVTLTLEDTETQNMKHAYLNKGYPDKSFSEVIKEHDKEIKNDSARGKKILEIIPPQNEKIFNIVVPANIDYFTWINREMKDRGFSYIKDKGINYLIHNTNKEFSKLQSLGDVYEYDTNPFSFTRIVQFNIDGFDMEAYLKSIPTSYTSIDIPTSNSKDSNDGTDTKISIKEPQKEVNVKTSGVNPGELALSHGQKQGLKTGKDKQYFETISNAQKCSIWAPGRTDNMVGRKITAIFPKPTYYSGTDNDKIFSGEWEVYMVRDKIIGMYYMQELFLRRPGGSNK